LESFNYDSNGSVTKEIRILEKYSSQHHRIIQMIDTFQLVYDEDRRLFLFGYTMEPLVCSLDKLVESNKIDIQKCMIRITEQLIEMTYQLHLGKVLHMDIKVDNIGVRSINPLELVLLDFGASEEIIESEKNRAWRTVGTAAYYSLLSETKPRLSYNDDLETV